MKLRLTQWLRRWLHPKPINPAFEAGFDAGSDYVNGRWDANPYPENTREHADWKLGFLGARNQQDG